MILFAGEHTPLASYLLPHLRNENQVCSFDSRKGDLCDTGFLSQLFDEIRPSVCINCEEVYDYTEAEIRRERAYALNGFAPGYLGELCKKQNIPLIHISTTSLYDHDSEEMRDEQWPVHPVSAYSDSKLLGEERIKQSGCRYCILRMSDLFGKRDNFLMPVFERVRQGNPVKVARQRMITPVYAGMAVQYISQAMKQGLEGIYNLSGGERVSEYEFLFRFFDLYQKEGGGDFSPDISEIDGDRILLPYDPVLHNCADAARLRKSTGIEAGPLDDGLLQLIRELQ